LSLTLRDDCALELLRSTKSFIRLKFNYSKVEEGSDNQSLIVSIEDDSGSSDENETEKMGIVRGSVRIKTQVEGVGFHE